MLERRLVDAVLAGLQARVRALAQLVQVPVLARDADDRDVEVAGLHHPLQRREDLAERQIAGHPEDDERVAPLAWAHDGLPASGFSACPPNCSRSADSSWSPKSASPRELKRSNSAVVSTGVGVPVSIAASAVQRPSPESETRPARWSSDGSAASAAAARSSSQRAHDGAAPPGLGDLRRVDLVAVVLGVAQRRRLRVDLELGAAGVRVREQVQALRVGRHHPVLDPVVDHLHEVTGTGRAAVNPALLLRRDGPLRPGVRGAESTPGARLRRIGVSRAIAVSSPPAISP